MGRHHARAAVLAGASIVAVVDSDREAGHALASRFPGAQSFGDLEGLLRTVDADAAHICTPADTHLELGETVANLGLHALVEKPFATNAAETKRLLEKFDKAGLIACPAHQYAFQRSLRSTIEALPRLGSLRQIAFDICSAGATRSGMDLDELVREILPHPLAMLQKLVPGAKIGELNWSCIRAAPGEWLIGARLDGTIVSIAMSMSGRPTRFLTRITADHGTTELDNFHDFAVSWPGQVSRIQKIASPFIRGSLVLAGASLNLMGRAARREFAYPGLGMLVREFYGAIRNPAACQAPISAEEAIAVAEARDRISRLAMNG
jgi:predicted dehydrogenase